MSCHPTDPSNPVSDKAKAKGTKEAPEHSVVRECAGAVILQQRELTALQSCMDEVGDDFDKGMRLYRERRSPSPMGKEGLFLAGMRAMTTWPGDIPMRKDHNLGEPVSRPGLIEDHPGRTS